jgi:hypothetical protein
MENQLPFPTPYSRLPAFVCVASVLRSTASSFPAVCQEPPVAVIPLVRGLGRAIN